MNRRLSTILSGALPLALCSFACMVPLGPLAVPYASEAPGPTFNTLGEAEGKPVVNVHGAYVDQTDGGLNLTTVSVYSGLSLLNVAHELFATNHTVVPYELLFPPNLSHDQVDEQNRMAFTDSEAAATIAAFKHLGIPTVPEIVGVLDDGPAAQAGLKGGVRLWSVDGTPVTVGSQVQEMVAAKKPGDVVELEISDVQEGQEADADAAKETPASENDQVGKATDSAKAAMTSRKKVSVTLGEHPSKKGSGFMGVSLGVASAEGITVNYNLEEVGGPSAGMMFSLAVVDKLTPGSLTKGRHIAGTGTISPSGEVGPIGGIVHKIEGAARDGATVFLAPTSNCDELRGHTFDGIEVISVATLDQAVEQLNNHAEGKAVQHCQ